MRSDHHHLTAYQIGCEVGQSVGLVLRPAIFDRQILAFDITSFFQALAERAQAVWVVKVGRIDAEKPDHRHRRLLRARREQPRNCGATESGDEIPSPHGPCLQAEDRTLPRRTVLCTTANFVADDRDGSFATETGRTDARCISAAPPKADASSTPWPRTQCAKTCRVQVQQTSARRSQTTRSPRRRARAAWEAL
jgi:hypothetical protein